MRLPLLFMVLSLLAVGCTRSLIYYPVNPSEAELQRQAQLAGFKPWMDKGERIGWVARAETAAPPRERSAMVVFHGNAGHAMQRSYYAMGFSRAGEESEDPPWDVYLFEYPGYGSRAGSPSEAVLKEAALAGLQSLLSEDYAALYLTGESLGSGVACHVAAELSGTVSGLFLVTPFTSLQDVARAHYPDLLVRLILGKRYDNEQALSRYDGPVAFLLAGDDDIIPVELGRRLHATYEGPKQLWVQEGRTHNTLSLAPGAAWWGEVHRFLTSSKQR